MVLYQIVDVFFIPTKYYRTIIIKTINLFLFLHKYKQMFILILTIIITKYIIILTYKNGRKNKVKFMSIKSIFKINVLKY